MPRAPWAADPILQAIWATCPHDDYVDGCTPCEYRLLALIEYRENARTA